MSAARRTALEWPLRAVFGLLLAVVALAANAAGTGFLASFVMLVALAAAREWHRMTGGQFQVLETLSTGGAIVVALVVLVLSARPVWAAGVLVGGALLASWAAYRHGHSAAWNGLGAIYIGGPALCLTALRTAPHGFWVIIGLFITIWTADTGAFVFGRFIGGPKFAPNLSPNKTWAGMLGGMVAPAAALSTYVFLLRGDSRAALPLALLLAIAAHAGDLFESWLKRRVGLKNSGGLIPGHGGVLDRIDSTLFAVPLAAALVFVFGVDLLCGARP